MATAGEGAGSYEGGGAGGKFRKKPFRRSQTTPYDRPPTALRNPSSNNSLFSKLVDPASKLIFASAHRLFGVFRNRLPPPPPQRPPETSQEPRDRLQEAVPNHCTGEPEVGTDQGGNSANVSDVTEISELEQMLKQKTFTRSEIERLTALLHSRTVDLPAKDEDKRDVPNLRSAISDISWHGASTSSPSNKIRDERDNFPATLSTPVVSSRLLEEDVASPAELAKAYMGSRPSQVSPSVLGMRSRALRQDSSLLKNGTLLPKTPIASLASKTANGVGVHENGFTTPRSRGRSAIYSMARTPYSRVHSTATQKGNRPTDYGYGGPSSSQSAWEHEGPSGLKQMALKRRISVLDDDIGSVGAMRRIRQKPNLSSQGSVLSTQKLLLMNEPVRKNSKAVEGNGNTSIASSSYAVVPTKSTETAAKILQHLEMLTPKEKSSESRLVATGVKSPTKLTPNMLHGQALKSLENVDSSKFLLSAQDSQKSKDLPDARDSVSQKKDSEESGPRKFAVPRNMLTPMNGDAKVSVRDNAPSLKTADSIIKLATEPPQKKRAFLMSVHEDSLEIDDDINSNGLVSTPVAESEKLETSVVVSKVVSTEALPEVDKIQALPEVVKSPTLTEVKEPADFVFRQRTDFGSSGASVVNEEKIGCTFPTSSSLSTTSQPPVLSKSNSAVDKIVPPQESNVSPSFSVNSKDTDRVSPFPFSANEPSGLKSNSLSDPKPENFNSLGNVASVRNDAQVKFSASDKGDYNNNQKAVDIVGNLPSAVSTATSTSGNFSFSAPAMSTNLNNGTLASSPSFFSSPAPVIASTNYTNQFFNNSVSQVASSSSTAAMPSFTASTAANGSLSTSSAAPIFGSSVTPSTSFSTVSTSVAETTDIMGKSNNGPNFGSISSSPFGATSFAMASTGSSPFVFSSSTASSTPNNQSQGSLFSTNSGSLANAQNTIGVAQSTHFQFGGSAASPVSGTSANLFSSTPSFGLGSAVSSSETNSGSSTSGAMTPGIFGSGWQSSKSSIFGNTLSSPSTGFSFGGASSTSLATTSSVLGGVFGSSNISGASLGSSMFSFTTAAATTSSFPSLSQTPSVFGNSAPVFGGNNNDQMNMEDSMAEDTMQSPALPAVPAFGQPSPSPSGFAFGSTAPTPSAVPFQFGGQPNQAPAQNLSPFQASGSLDFSARGSFSLGSGGGDKSNRKIVRVVRSRNRKK